MVKENHASNAFGIERSICMKKELFEEITYEQITAKIGLEPDFVTGNYGNGCIGH